MILGDIAPSVILGRDPLRNYIATVSTNLVLGTSLITGSFLINDPVAIAMTGCKCRDLVFNNVAALCAVILSSTIFGTCGSLKNYVCIGVSSGISGYTCIIASGIAIDNLKNFLIAAALSLAYLRNLTVLTAVRLYDYELVIMVKSRLVSDRCALILCATNLTLLASFISRLGASSVRCRKIFKICLCTLIKRINSIIIVVTLYVAAFAYLVGITTCLTRSSNCFFYIHVFMIFYSKNIGAENAHEHGQCHHERKHFQKRVFHFSSKKCYSYI